MQCLHCGYCCKNMAVAVVDDPSLGVVEGNVIFNLGGGSPCKHLQGREPGKHACAVHDEPWYPDTPCYRHGQVERSDSPCRMGQYILGICKGKEQEVSDG